MPIRGHRGAYRPAPPNFVEVYMAEGVNGACLTFCAHKRSVNQWIAENGGPELIDRRLRHLADAGRRGTVNRDLAQRIRRAREAVRKATATND